MPSSRTAIARATAVTLIVWVSRLCTTPLVALGGDHLGHLGQPGERRWRTGSAPSRCGTPTPPPRTGAPALACDLASRASMVRTLPKRPPSGVGAGLKVAPRSAHRREEVIEVKESGSVM